MTHDGFLGKKRKQYLAKKHGARVKFKCYRLNPSLIYLLFSVRNFWLLAMELMKVLKSFEPGLQL